jgi:hypothetical protein
MDSDESVNEWSSEDESERQPSNVSVGAQRLLQSQRRPANRALSFIPYMDWNPEQAYDDLPPSCMHYFME